MLGDDNKNMQHQYWKAICGLAAVMGLCSACSNVNNPEEIAILQEKSDAVMAMAAETAPTETTVTTAETTTVTTTTTTDLCAPFIDYDMDIVPMHPKWWLYVRLVHHQTSMQPWACPDQYPACSASRADLRSGIPAHLSE